MLLRLETPADRDAIHALTTQAFDGHPHSDGSEPAIIDRLREAGALSLSIVAEDEGQIIGHAAFSPVAWAGQSHWYGLGPVSVAPSRQGQGIGKAVIEDGLERLRADGACGCVVMGDPDYYGRFGFQQDARFTYPGVPAAYFQALVWQADAACAGGDVRYHPAFG